MSKTKKDSKEKFDVTINFENAPDTSKMNKLSEDDVDRLLTTIPPTKLAQARKVLVAMDDRDTLIDNHKMAVAVARLQAATMKEELSLGSDKDREAWTITQASVKKARREEMSGILEVKLQEYIHEYLEDMFISARKQANKYEKAIEADAQVAKYMKH